MLTNDASSQNWRQRVPAVKPSSCWIAGITYGVIPIDFKVNSRSNAITGRALNQISVRDRISFHQYLSMWRVSHSKGQYLLCLEKRIILLLALAFNHKRQYSRILKHSVYAMCLMCSLCQTRNVTSQSFTAICIFYIYTCMYYLVGALKRGSCDVKNSSMFFFQTLGNSS